MLIDHAGRILFPEYIIFQIIGRLAMPLYAYSIAKGFRYSLHNGTILIYIRNIFLLAICSQLPYYLMMNNGLNTAFTWLFSLLLLSLLEGRYRYHSAAFCGVLISICILIIRNILPVDYGVSGVLTPLLFYLLIKAEKETTVNYVFMLLVIWAIFTVESQSIGSIIQIFSVLSAFILSVTKEIKSVTINKRFYYWYYPAHIIVLLIIKFILKGC